MIENIAMSRKVPGFLSDGERVAIFGAEHKSLQKKQVGFRLTNEALAILDQEAKKWGDRTKALEVLLREIRELRKKRSK